MSLPSPILSLLVRIHLFRDRHTDDIMCFSNHDCNECLHGVCVCVCVWVHARARACVRACVRDILCDRYRLLTAKLRKRIKELEVSFSGSLLAPKTLARAHTHTHTHVQT